jgi:hypothetical protein
MPYITYLLLIQVIEQKGQSQKCQVLALAETQATKLKITQAEQTKKQMKESAYKEISAQA